MRGHRTIKRLGVVGRRKLTSGLHMPLEVPEHPQADVRDVHDVRTKSDGRLGVYSVGALGRQRLDEARQVLVQRKQPEQLRRCFPVCFRSAIRGLGRLLVLGDGMGVEMPYLVYIDGDAPALESKPRTPNTTFRFGCFTACRVAL